MLWQNLPNLKQTSNASQGIRMSKSPEYPIGKDCKKKVRNYQLIVQDWIKYIKEEHEGAYIPNKLLHTLQVRKQF